LHALTGWIPERVAIRPKDEDFNATQLFQMLETNLRNGNALVTIATGELSEIEADRAGLVPTHAYAVLDVRKVNVSSKLEHTPRSLLTAPPNPAQVFHDTPSPQPVDRN